LIDLAALLREGEELEDLMNLSPEDLLLRWVVTFTAKNKLFDAEDLLSVSRCKQIFLLQLEACMNIFPFKSV